MRLLAPILILAVLLQSCSEYQKVLKNEEVKPKYDLAQKFYEEGDMKRANRLFEQIAPKYVGKPQGERVMFFLADTYFKRKDFNTAGYQYERFVKSYPKSEKVAEASFYGAKSYFELSPRHSLDQTDTDKALAKLQNFINAYPDSEYFDEANAMAKELTTKKERKAYEIAKQFNKIGEFDFTFLTPAVSAFDNFISDFPGSIYREDAMYYRFESASQYALNSFQALQRPRLKEAKEYYATLKKQFPETKYAEKADKLLEKVNEELEGFQQLTEAK
ncbi:Beta-barrel assembly machine subunit BamD [Flavobacteriaceae bacterium MAR_2009_75]|uniref:outer membrane protein assembly factor BamD n=1 Tax=Pseudozobellia sp. WGM2 TaxID=2787625 RepID=UPI000CAAB1A3|nr:outer membrane protein assembly factor BamD [Pseudozobellia sp. WGM2]PKA96616.1 Beta-barrel assembly machine subunit BamD [Flavobacteriaceae bacterium MAR_2009_75]